MLRYVNETGSLLNVLLHLSDPSLDGFVCSSDDGFFSEPGNNTNQVHNFTIR